MSADLDAPAHPTDASGGTGPDQRSDAPGAGLRRARRRAGGRGHASDRGARIAAVAIALAWHLAIGLPAVLGAWSEFAAPAVVAGGWLAGRRDRRVAGVRLLRGVALPPVCRWPWLLLVVDAAVFAAAGERQFFTAANWVWGTLGWFFVLVLWGRPSAG